MTWVKSSSLLHQRKVEVSRFEGDMEKLGELYWKGYHDAEDKLDALKAYPEK